MILRMIVKMSLEEEDGKVIKEQEFGTAYMEDMDMAKAAADWWKARYNKHKRTLIPRDCFRISKIADILTAQLKDQILNKFLCDRDAIYKEHKDEL